MKTFIVGLFSLVVLASGAAWGHKPVGTPANEGGLPGIQGFCNANMGIFVIIVKGDGKAYFWKCQKVKGETITQTDTHPNEGGYSDHLEPYDLGNILKTRQQGGGTDTCITWAVGGKSYYYCWG